MKIKKFRIISLFAFLFVVQFAKGQIHGQISSEKGEPIEFVTVVLKKAIDSSFISYTRTNENGFYTIDSKTNGKFLLSFSSLGFAKKEILLDIEDFKLKKILDVI